MGFFDRFRKDARNNYGFTDEDRKLSAERRQAKMELDKINLENAKREKERQAEIAEKKFEVDMAKLEYEKQKYLPEEDEDDDYLDELPQQMGISEEGMMFMNLLNKVQAPRPASTVPFSTTHPPTAPQAVEVSDEQLKEYWDKVPTHIKAFVPKCNDDQIKEFVTKQMIPGASEDTLNRAVKLARSSV